jgi:hypothetical protein
MSYKELFVIVEGEAELNFVNRMLQPHLNQFGIVVSTMKITTGYDSARNKAAKGGLMVWDHLIVEVNHKLSEAKKRMGSDANCSIWVTTFFALYGLRHQSRGLDYDKLVANCNSAIEKANRVESYLAECLSSPNNFIPYCQLYEYEAFIMVDVFALSVEFLEHDSKIRALEKDIKGLLPEEINERPTHAPSKRIERHIPEYKLKKSSSGYTVVKTIGLDRLRQSMPHFDNWITTLEGL